MQPALVEQLKTDLMNSISWQAKETVTNVLGAEIKAWCAENLIPEIRALLTESKEGLVASIVPATEQMAAALGKAMAETMLKNLDAGSYKRDDIFKALFGLR